MIGGRVAEPLAEERRVRLGVEDLFFEFLKLRSEMVLVSLRVRVSLSRIMFAFGA